MRTYRYSGRADVLPSILLSGTRPNVFGSLLGQETIFGCILTEPVPAPRQNQIFAFSTRISHTSDKSLDKLLTKFWEVEDLQVKVAKASVMNCEENFLRTTTRDDNCRYVESLPFRDPENVKPPDLATKISPKKRKVLSQIAKLFDQPAGSLHLLCVPKSLCKRFGLRI